MEELNSENGGPNPNRTHFNAGTAKGASHASYAQQLRHWFYNTQHFYATQEAFAAALGVSIDTLRPYLNGKSFPSDPICDRLYSLTQLLCFSPVGRIAARAEHLRKKGLSPAAILKRAERRYLSPEELAECIADPDKAFVIRGVDWIACLECGQLLRFIRGRGAAAHLKEHGISAEQYRVKWGYSKSTGLIARTLAAIKRTEVESRGNLKPDAGLANLQPQKKGWKVSREFRAKTAHRMRGRRNPDWAKPIADVEFVWAWLLDGKDLEEVAQAIAKLSPDGRFTLGGVHRRLKSIVDAPVRRALPQDPEVASRAVTVAHACTGDDAKFRLALAELVTESRNEVARKVDCKARRTLLWIPAARTWLQSDPTRAPLSPEDLARVFLATVYGKAKKNSTVIKKPKGSGGRRKKSDSERWESKVLRLVEQEVPRIERGQTMLSSLKVRYPANPGEWGNHLRRERYSSEEVTALLDNHSTIGAAQAVVSKSLKIALKSLQVACSKARRFKG